MRCEHASVSNFVTLRYDPGKDQTDNPDKRHSMLNPAQKIRTVTLVGIFMTLSSEGAIPEKHAGLPHAFEAGWRGQRVCELLHEDDIVSIGRCRFPPGVGHERHFHRPHFGYALSAGTMRIEDTDGVRVSKLPAGTTWSTDEITVHEVLNIGETTTTYLIVEPKE